LITEINGRRKKNGNCAAVRADYEGRGLDEEVKVERDGGRRRQSGNFRARVFMKQGDQKWWVVSIRLRSEQLDGRISRGF